MRKLYAQLLLLLFLIPSAAWSQVLSWNLVGAKGNETSIAVTGVDLHLNNSSLTRGSGVASTSLANGFSSTGWDASTLAAAETGNKYYQFTVNGLDGWITSLSTLDCSLRISGTGPKFYQWEYSLDGFATAGHAIGSTVNFTNTNSNGVAQPQILLSGIADLQNIPSGTTVTIRLYAYGASQSTGTFAVGKPASGNSLAIGGTVNPITSSSVLTISPASLTGFTTSAGTASTSQRVTLNGTGLTNDVMVTAPAGYELSKDNNTFATSLTITNTGGSANQNIYARIATSATEGALNGRLVATSSGAAGQVVALTGNVTAAALPIVAKIVINQVYGGGSNSNAQYNSDFIELYNDDDTAVNLNGWSVQYASASGTSWSVTNLTGIIPAHNFFLIQESGGSSGAALPSPDVAGGTINMSATNGKVLLASTTTPQTGGKPTGASIMDFVGYGSADTAEVQATPALSNTTAAVRKVDGVDGNNNFNDFQVSAPLPRNSTYKTAPPVVTAMTPPNDRTDVPYNIVPTLTFNKQVVKASGTITLITNGTAGTPIDVSDASIVLSNGNTVTINQPLSGNTSYAINVSSGAFTDIYGNAYAGTGTTGWTFTTYNNTVSVTPDYVNDFTNCSGTGLLPGGFTQYSVIGDQKWDCTTFSLDSTANPRGAVQMNGYANGVDNVNEDWLISPRFDLTDPSGIRYPLLSFWSKSEFAGSALQLKVSTDYSGTGNPNLAHWSDLNGHFPSSGSSLWTRSANINLFDYKQDGVYIAFVYTSTTDDGLRATVDSFKLAFSDTPPPPSLTISSSNVEFGYTAANSTTDRKITILGNDLTSDITVSSEGSFLVSVDSVNFSTSVTIGHDTANNKTEPVFVRFAPGIVNLQYFDSLYVSTQPNIQDTIHLKGNTISPASTLNVIDWNLNWFATPEAGFGPTDKNLQIANVRTILPKLNADLYVLEEVVNEAALADIVANNMPGYAYVINNYGSHANTFDPTNYPLNTVQKLAFIYNTAKIKNIHTDSLLNDFPVNTNDDWKTRHYSDWAGGRYPYMLTADVTLDDNNGGTNTHTLHFINIHAKANTGDLGAAYTSRANGAFSLDSMLRASYSQPTDNVMILGDFNDDLNQTIATGIGTTASSYSVFTSSPADYIFPTMILSQQGQHSDVNYTSVIDNVIVNKNMSKWYLPSSATVLSDVQSLVPKYGTTTTDHLPVFSQFSFTPPVALPVTLLSFTATKKEATTELAWATTAEANSVSFVIERSGDNKVFTAIGTVAAQGNSSTTTKYAFVDQQPLTGNNYYRLKQVDIDGKFTYSKTLLLNFGALSLRISPNPAHGTANLFIGNSDQAYAVLIVDETGRAVKHFITIPGAANIPIDVSGLAKGIYTVQVVSAKEAATQKLLIQ